MTGASDAPQGLPQVCWRFARCASLRCRRNKGQCWRQEHLRHAGYILAGTAACALHSPHSMRLMRTQAMVNYMGSMPTVLLTCKCGTEHAQCSEAHQAKREAAPSLGDPGQLQPLTREGACCPVIAANSKQDLQDCIHMIIRWSCLQKDLHIINAKSSPVHQHCMLYCTTAQSQDVHCDNKI